ncbi:MAG: DUF58 domain-containing protein [Thermoleophilaceae bacterium]
MSRALAAVVLGVALDLCAAAFDSPSLYVPGVALVLLGGGAAVWVALAAQGAGVDRELGPPTVEEDRTYPLRLEVRLPLFALAGELVEPLIGRSLPLRSFQRRPIRLEVRFGRRGKRLLAPARLVVRDPLGLAERTRESEPAEVLVLPRIEEVVTEGGGAGRRGSRDGASLTAEVAEIELDSLRPYRPGAPASRIHWPTSARTGEMMERHLVSDADSRPLVVLDPRAAATEDALDAAVRAAASLCVHLAKQRGASLLLPGERRASDIDKELRAWPALHARLALIGADSQPPAAGRLERTGPVFWVMAATGEPPAGVRRAAARARFVVRPGEWPGHAAAFSVAGCYGYRLDGARARRAA